MTKVREPQRGFTDLSCCSWTDARRRRRWWCRLSAARWDPGQIHRGLRFAGRRFRGGRGLDGDQDGSQGRLVLHPGLVRALGGFQQHHRVALVIDAPHHVALGLVQGRQTREFHGDRLIGFGGGHRRLTAAAQFQGVGHRILGLQRGGVVRRPGVQQGEQHQCQDRQHHETHHGKDPAARFMGLLRPRGAGKFVNDSQSQVVIVLFVAALIEATVHGDGVSREFRRLCLVQPEFRCTALTEPTAQSCYQPVTEGCRG